MIIWLLYGAEGLGEFNESVKTGSGDSSPFYQVFHTGEKKLAKVHEAVVLWMRYISKDPACHAGITALGDLLELVERGLLVVKLPSHGGLIQTNRRLSYYRMQLDGPDDALSNPYSPPESTSPGAKFTALHYAAPYDAHEVLKMLLNIESRQEERCHWSTERSLTLPVVQLGLRLQIGDVGDVYNDNNNNEVYFTIRCRRTGSKNKPRTQNTSDIMEKWDLPPSNSRPSKRKLQDDDDQGDSNDKQHPLRGKNGKYFSVPCELVCPFAKYQPLEYPQCRGSRYRDIAKIK
jgi:hypothetical protein